jgi:hypothetical protein
MPVNLPADPKLLERSATRRETTDTFEKQMVRQATELLESHPHFRGRGRWVYCRCSRGNLELLGVVPSYYLKQLAQEALRNLSGTRQIINRIQVAGPDSCLRPESEAMKSIRKAR